MSDDQIPVAVVGTGNMGTNHARVFDDLPGADLVEIVEPDESRASEIAGEYDVRAHESVEDLTDAEAATVAVPNEFHRPVAEQLFEDGLDVLVEKPLAISVKDAQAIVETAQEADAVLQVGHIERFNPAVELLKEILEDEQIVAMEAHRLGPFNEHLTDNDVVFDLMIHDLDIVDTFLDGPLKSVAAAGAKPRSPETDQASVLLEYESGKMANITSSHVTHGKVRELSVTTIDAYITLEYQKQRITIQHRGEGTTTTMSEKARYRTETVTETPFVRTREPLKNELEHYLSAVRDRSTPRVAGAEGIRAVELASSVTDRI